MCIDRPCENCPGSLPCETYIYEIYIKFDKVQFFYTLQFDRTTDQRTESLWKLTIFRKTPRFMFVKFCRSVRSVAFCFHALHQISWFLSSIVILSSMNSTTPLFAAGLDQYYLSALIIRLSHSDSSFWWGILSETVSTVAYHVSWC